MPPPSKRTWRRVPPAATSSIGCGTCWRLVDVEEVPEPPPGFERQVWARLVPELETRKTPWLSRLFRLRSGSPFEQASARQSRWGRSGRLQAAWRCCCSPRSSPAASRAVPPPKPPASSQPPTAGDVSERVLVVAVVDHLDRSQMMLVELLNAEPGRAAGRSRHRQSRARELVAENRLYRVSAAAGRRRRHERRARRARARPARNCQHPATMRRPATSRRCASGSMHVDSCSRFASCTRKCASASVRQ